MGRMRNRLFQLISGISELSLKPLQRSWLKPGLIAAVVILVAVGIPSILLSREETQAAPGSARASNSSQDENLPFDYQFVGQGRISGGSEQTWIIGDVPIHVNGHTQVADDLHVGDFVSLSGRILQDGRWLADRIELTPEDSSFFTYNGPLEWMRAGTWRIGGHSLLVDEHTEVESGLGIDQILLATFTGQGDGAWLALKIEAFDKFPATPTPAVSPTPKPTKRPTKTPVPAAPAQPAKAAPKSKPADNSGTVTLCHRPNGKSKGKTLTLNAGAAQSHLAHGDTMGPCR
jgi:hypothetical protein